MHANNTFAEFKLSSSNLLFGVFKNYSWNSIDINFNRRKSKALP